MINASKKHILKSKEKQETALVLAIVSSLPDYTVAWHLNQKLGINLQQSRPIALNLQHKKNASEKSDLFSQEKQEQKQAIYYVFNYHDGSMMMDYFLIVNRGMHDFLVPQHKEIAYFFEVKTKNKNTTETIITALKSISSFQLVYHFSNESLTNALQLFVQKF